MSLWDIFKTSSPEPEPEIQPEPTVVEKTQSIKEYVGEKGYRLLKNKLFYGSLPEFQEKPLITLIETCLRENVVKVEQISYVLGTAYHESGRFKYKEEIGKGKGRDYGVPLLVWRNKRMGYHGRGWVQLTWLGNYGQFTAKLSALTGKEIDLVNQPELITDDPEINSYITVVGMKEGLFTGKCLDDYINQDAADYYNARRIVNGVFHADQVAKAARIFEEALRHG